MLRDRHGVADGRRLYRVKTEDLKAHPIAPTVRMDDMVFLVEYSRQPVQCFLCKGFGHIRSDCPNAVTTPSDRSPSPSEMSSPRGTDEQPAEVITTPALEIARHATSRVDTERAKATDVAVLASEERCSSTPHSTDLQHVTLEKVVGVQKEILAASTQPVQPDSNLLETIRDADLHTLSDQPDKQTSDTSSSSEQEDFENPDPSIFATDDEETEAGIKRQHSPEEVTTAKKTTTSLGENFDCECGQNVFISNASGCFTECMCGICHVRCTCKNIIALKGSGIAYCTYCHKSAPRRNLDLTV